MVFLDLPHVALKQCFLLVFLKLLGFRVELLDLGAIFKCGDFFESDKLLLHADVMVALLKDILLLSSAVWKCPPHVNSGVLVSTGDAQVDVAVKVSTDSAVY